MILYLTLILICSYPFIFLERVWIPFQNFVWGYENPLVFGLGVWLPSCYFGSETLNLGPHDLNKNLRWDFSQILEMLPQWRHNGFFDVLRWGTLTPSIFVQFSSNWHMLLFISWLCMGLQSSVFGSYLLSEMTVGKTVKN